MSNDNTQKQPLVFTLYVDLLAGEDHDPFVDGLQDGLVSAGLQIDYTLMGDHLKGVVSREDGSDTTQDDMMKTFRIVRTLSEYTLGWAKTTGFFPADSEEIP